MHIFLDVGFLEVVARLQRMIFEGWVGKDGKHVRSGWWVLHVWGHDAGGMGDGEGARIQMQRQCLRMLAQLLLRGRFRCSRCSDVGGHAVEGEI